MSKRINHGEEKSHGGESVEAPHHGLRLVYDAKPGTKRSVAADDELRELLNTFKRSRKVHRQSSDDDLLPAA